MNSYSESPTFKKEVQDTTRGELPTFDNSSITENFVGWNKMSKFFSEMRNSGSVFANKNYNGLVTNFNFDSIPSEGFVENKHHGAILGPDGSIHFVPYNTNYGWKIKTNPTNNFSVMSTYSFVTTYTGGLRFLGGALSPSGDIYFVPSRDFQVGQKVNASGTVSTYALAYTSSSSFLYDGAVLSPSGDIHFVPRNATIGHKISKEGISSTYPLRFSTSGAYRGGVLAPDGSIHFVPFNAIKPNSSGFNNTAIPLGQKVTVEGVVRTYEFPVAQSLGTNQYFVGGVLDSEGSIHFIPYRAFVGHKYNVFTDSITTYQLPSSAYYDFQKGGVLGPDGSIFIPPGEQNRGLRIYTNGNTTVVTTWQGLASNYSYGGVLAPNGSLFFAPYSSTGIKIDLNSSFTPSLGLCMSPFLNTV